MRLEIRVFGRYLQTREGSLPCHRGGAKGSKRERKEESKPVYRGVTESASVHNGAPCRGSVPDTATSIDEMQSTPTPDEASRRPSFALVSLGRMAGRPASQFANVNEIIGRTGGKMPLVFALTLARPIVDE